MQIIEVNSEQEVFDWLRADGWKPWKSTNNLAKIVSGQSSSENMLHRIVSPYYDTSGSVSDWLNLISSAVSNCNGNKICFIEQNHFLF